MMVCKVAGYLGIIGGGRVLKHETGPKNQRLAFFRRMYVFVQPTQTVALVEVGISDVANIQTLEDSHASKAVSRLL